MNELSSPTEKNIGACQAALLKTKKPNERMIVFGNDRLVEFIANDAEIKPGGRFNPKKKIQAGKELTKVALFGGLGAGVLAGMDVVIEGLNAYKVRLEYLICQKLDIIRDEYPKHTETPYSEVKEMLWNKFSFWGGQKFSLLLADDTRRDYEITTFSKDGRDALERVLQSILGSRFRRIES